MSDHNETRDNMSEHERCEGCEVGACLAGHVAFVDESHDWTPADVERILTEVRSIRGEVSS